MEYWNDGMLLFPILQYSNTPALESMSNLVVLGLQWGDEGKGKIVDIAAENYDIIARYQGGHNAGHTVNIGDTKFVLHLIPSGILHPDKQCVIGNGVVIDPEALLTEIDELTQQGIEHFEGRLFISARAHVIMPYHRILDRRREATRGKKKIGTTGRGIGPCYESKMGRSGVLIADLFNEERFREKVESSLAYIHHIIQDDLPELSYEKICDTYLACAERIRPYMADCSLLLAQAVKAGKHVLLEGAQGVMLDVDHGTYPFVTSSSASTGGACTGLGLGPKTINSVVGVIKAYTTRVGEGPFPTELLDENGEQLRDTGSEFGATTGRPRRCGWFDAVVGRYAVRVNGVDSLAVTKLDVLDAFPTLKICTGYMLRGELLAEIPMEPGELQHCTPIYEEHPGWQQSTVGLERYDDLPEQAKDYLNRIAELLETDISMISTGPKRRQTIVVKNV